MMQSLRKKCVRCQAPIDQVYPGESEPVYRCLKCDSVGSAIEHRDFIHQAELPATAISLDTKWLGQQGHIFLGDLPSGEVLSGLFGLMVATLVFYLLLLPFSRWLAWGLLLFFVLLGVIMIIVYAIIDNRSYELVIDPYTIKFYRKILGWRYLHKTIPSYALDRIQVQVAAAGNKKMIQYEMLIQTKQYEQYKPFFRSAEGKDKLLAVKYALDHYLNIRPRSSDVKIDVKKK